MRRQKWTFKKRISFEDKVDTGARRSWMCAARHEKVEHENTFDSVVKYAYIKGRSLEICQP